MFEICLKEKRENLLFCTTGTVIAIGDKTIFSMSEGNFISYK